MSRSGAAVRPVPLAERLSVVKTAAPAPWLERRPDAAPPRPLFTPARDEQAAHAAQARDAVAAAEARAAAAAAQAATASVALDAERARYADGVAALARAAREARAAAPSDLVDLALVVARELCGRELAADRGVVMAAVAAALDEVGGHPDVVVRLAPADLTYLREQRPDLAEAGIELLADEGLAPGGCVVESSRCVVDGSVEARLAAVRDALARAVFGEDACSAT
jgi:flagellar biosynthesis/type III secretory pathway protein FliH